MHTERPDHRDLVAALLKVNYLKSIVQKEHETKAFIDFEECLKELLSMEVWGFSLREQGFPLHVPSTIAILDIFQARLSHEFLETSKSP